ncbi:DUF4192 domain-containing protein [Actinoalloteichus hymeniacidonis]|uniref:DUF4192 family protein n=1 Tax=Actinoalloteichus hymeniacidonis TaxID=340345 RepID=A0AAC9HNI4_9PSEU|nr:DUF4192 domain-containing protein [Actinoalloteichus hymeniacidonis]AOS62545.1 putative DUF4192 family protein [Actinoalloteichus hymeniacidonis]MBB5909424.1 hypothetical protein [Actinoalloteichus hymeniacidonis]
MTTRLSSCVRLNDPGELIAAVPHLLGFHPVDSLVLITLKDAGQSKVGLTLRVDLPATDDHEALAASLLPPITTQQATGVMVIVVGGGDHSRFDGPPHRDVVGVVERMLAEAAVPCLHSIWTPDTAAGSRWQCFGEDDCHGRLPDPGGTTLAAASVVAGAVTFADRTELAELLNQDPAPDLERRAELLAAATEAGDLDRTLSGTATARRDLAALHRALESTERNNLLVDDDLVVRLAFALTDRRVRDACMRWCSGPRAVAAERLWLELTRAIPEPERAEPATLLGLCAYLRGNGALAGVALSAALRARPDHVLASLLDDLLQSGMAPDQLRAVVSDSAEEALLAIEMGEEEPW